MGNSFTEADATVVNPIHPSATTDSNAPQTAKPTDKRTASSRGAASFTQDLRGRQSKFGQQVDRVPPPIPEDAEITKFFHKNQHCCSLRHSDGHNCFAQHFLVENKFYDASIDEPKARLKVNTDAICDVVRRFRKVTRLQDSIAYDHHVQQIIRASITSRTKQKGDYTYTWELNLLGGSSGAQVGPYQVCKPTFLWVWGVTDHHYKEVIKAFKSSDDGYVASTTVRPLNDNSRAYLAFSSDALAEHFSANVMETTDEGHIIPARLGKVSSSVYYTF